MAIGESGMGLFKLYFSLDGRIPRLTYWLATLPLCPLMLVLWLGLTAALIGDPFSTAIWAEILAERSKLSMVSIGVFILSFWPGFAVSAKRLRDRDRPIWIYPAYMVLAVLPDIVVLSGYAGPEEKTSLLVIAALLVVLVASLLLIVELGFLRGTPGPNRHGPDPLPPAGEQTGNIWHLLFSLDGRIGRARWWLGAGITAGVFLLLTLLAWAGIRAAEWQTGAERIADKEWLKSPEAYPFFLKIGLIGSAWFMVAAPLLLWPSLALGIKRLHDRDMGGWLVLVLPIVFFLAIIAISVALELAPANSAVETAAWSAVALTAIWYFVQVGGLPGSAGTNRFGPASEH